MLRGAAVAGAGPSHAPRRRSAQAPDSDHPSSGSALCSDSAPRMRARPVCQPAGERIADGNLAVARPNRVHQVPGRLRVPSRQQHGAGRRAYGAGRERVRQQRPFGRERVDVGRRDLRLAEQRQGRGAKLVGQQAEKVRSGGHQRGPVRRDGEMRPAITVTPRSRWSGRLTDHGVMHAVDWLAGHQVVLDERSGHARPGGVDDVVPGVSDRIAAPAPIGGGVAG